jgi:uncharacterized membrane protein HdeD (DUF308 family)
MGKVLAAWCFLVGVLLGCYGSLLLLFWFGSPDHGGEWLWPIAGVVCVSASIISMLVGRPLWRSDEY